MSDHALYQIARELHSHNLSIDYCLKTILNHSATALGIDQAYLVTLDDAAGICDLYTMDDDHDENDLLQLLRDVLNDQAYLADVHREQMLRILPDLEADERWHVAHPLMSQTGSALYLPLSSAQVPFAVMLLIHPETDYFSPAIIDFLTEVRAMTDDAIGNVQHIQRQVQDVRYQAIFEHNPVPIVLTNKSGVIVDINCKACDYLGFRRNVLRGVPFQDVNVVSTEDIASITEKECHFRTDVCDIDGKLIPTLIRARLIYLEGETFIEWVMQDMTVQMELDQLRRDLSAMIYHDLRGPLGNIHMSILKLAELISGNHNPAIRKLMQLGLRSTQQVTRLVESLLDIQRLEAGSTILNQQPNELHILLPDTLQLVLPTADEHGVHIDVDIMRLPLISMDADMIKRVIINLLENAIKYTPNDGTITLRTEQDHSEVRVIISDNGPGIPETMRNSIFDKFNRVKYQDAPKGVGLGLAFCRLAIEAHGGRIWVESDGQTGSDFIFALPLPKHNFDAHDAEGRDVRSQEYASTV